MKVLHTADWHLGQTFYDYDRKAEHKSFLKWLIEQVSTHKVDVLLIAGDVFDSPNPSAESQKMYYHFLRDITNKNPNLQLIIIAGNHDSAARLESPNALLEMIHATVRGVVKRTAEGEIDFEHLVVPLHKGGYCLAIPYLRQGDYPASDNYAQGVQRMYELAYEQLKDKQQPIIAMGHLQATGSEISENDRAERTVIGGLECISPTSFAKELAYTALGHLHRGQRVSGRDNVRYSGAPLPMSFAEKNNRQGVVLVTLKETTTIEFLEFTPPVKLISIPHMPLPLENVLSEIATLPDGEVCATSPYTEIKILITEPEPSLKIQIEKALEGKAVRLARITAVIPQNNIREHTITYEQLQTINPMDMACDIFQRKYGGECMPTKMKNLLQSVIQEIEQ